MRKTVDVADLVDYVNGVLASEHGNPELRKGAILVLEHALGAAGQYNGYRHLSNLDLREHVLPGVRYGENGMLPYPERFQNTDDTRRQYAMKLKNA